MTPEQKLTKRQEIIDTTFERLGRTEAAVHVIAENWSNEENKRLIKENRDQQQELDKLKNIKR